MTGIDTPVVEGEMARAHTLREALALPLGRTALAYLAGIILAESLTVLVEPRLGLALHAILLVALTTHAGLTWELPRHKLLVGLAFAPLIRIVSLSFPLARVPLIYWYAVTAVPLLIAALIAWRVLGLTWLGVDLTARHLPLQIVVSLTGMGLGYLEYRILQPAPLIEQFTLQQLWLPALILLICTGLMEEVIFRGVMQEIALETLGRWGMVYVAIVFAVLHLGYRSLLDVLFVLLVALYFGWVVRRTRSLVGVTLAHGLTNIMLFLVVPFIPGMRSVPPSTTPLRGTPLPTRAVVMAPATTKTPALVRTPLWTRTMEPTAFPSRDTTVSATPTLAQGLSTALPGATGVPTMTSSPLATQPGPTEPGVTLMPTLAPTSIPFPTLSPTTVTSTPPPTLSPTTAATTAAPARRQWPGLQWDTSTSAPLPSQLAAWARDTVWVHVHKMNGWDDLSAKPNWQLLSTRQSSETMGYRYQSENWAIEVELPTLAVERILYPVRITGPEGFAWQGTVDVWGAVEPGSR